MLREQWLVQLGKVIGSSQCYLILATASQWRIPLCIRFLIQCIWGGNSLNVFLRNWLSVSQLPSGHSMPDFGQTRLKTCNIGQISIIDVTNRYLMTKGHQWIQGCGLKSCGCHPILVLNWVQFSTLGIRFLVALLGSGYTYLRKHFGKMDHVHVFDRWPTCPLPNLDLFRFWPLSSTSGASLHTLRNLETWSGYTLMINLAKIGHWCGK